jgi:hypothetical protein
MNINDIYTCDYSECGLYLKEPISLPCGKSICKSHTNSNNNDTFKCISCEKTHKIEEDGFQVNTKLLKLIEMNQHLSGKHKEVKEMLDKLYERILNFKSSDLAEPDVYLDEYFFNLRTQIDLHREQFIEEIHRKSDEILKKLKELENEYTLNKVKFPKIDLDEFYQPVWEELLRDPCLNQEDLEVIDKKLKHACNDLDKQLKIYQCDLLMNRKIIFEPFNNNSFGNLITKSDSVRYYKNGYYKGEMLNGRANGIGTFFWDDGDSFAGEWKDDKRTGFGIRYYSNGDRYEGYYVEGFKDGIGKQIKSNGETTLENWKKGMKL